MSLRCRIAYRTAGHTTLKFEGFEKALRVISVEAAGGGDAEVAHAKICAHIIAQGAPSLEGTTAPETGGGVFARLTDPGLYTGASKERFE